MCFIDWSAFTYFSVAREPLSSFFNLFCIASSWPYIIRYQSTKRLSPAIPFLLLSLLASFFILSAPQSSATGKRITQMINPKWKILKEKEIVCFSNNGSNLRYRHKDPVQTTRTSNRSRDLPYKVVSHQLLETQWSVYERRRWRSQKIFSMVHQQK